jgi:FG-GAP repeat
VAVFTLAAVTPAICKSPNGLSFSDTSYDTLVGGDTEWVSVGDVNGDKQPDLVYSSPNGAATPVPIVLWS